MAGFIPELEELVGVGREGRISYHDIQGKDPRTVLRFGIEILECWLTIAG